MTSIFISYRRSDSVAHAGRIAATLRRHPARPAVFFDSNDIEPGQLWPESLEMALTSCDVMLVVIGPKWLAPASGATRSRLHDPDDVVAREIRVALGRKGVRVIPVRVGQAALPAAADLPPDLAPLLKHQATELRDDAFDQDLGALEARLLAPRRWPWFAGAATALALAGMGWQFWPQLQRQPQPTPLAAAPAPVLPKDADVELHFTPHPLMLQAKFPDRRVQLLQDLPDMRDPMPFKRMPALADGRLVFVRNGYTLPVPGQAFVGRLIRDDNDTAVELVDATAAIIHTPVCFSVGKSATAPTTPLKLDCKEGVGCKPEGDNGGLITPCGTRQTSQAGWPDLLPSAIAAPAPATVVERPQAGDWVVPSLASLQERRGSPRAVAYSEISLRSAPVAQAGQADRVALDVSINGRRLWVNGLPAWATAVPSDAARGLQLAFGIENLNAAGKFSGRERLQVRLIFLRGTTPVFEDSVVIDDYIALRLLPGGTVRGQVVAVDWKATYHPAPADQYQVFAYGSKLGADDTLRVKTLVDQAGLNGPPVLSGGAVVGVVRPPVREGAAWGVALSVRQPSGQLRFSFDADLTKALCNQIAGAPEFKRLQLGTPLVRIIAYQGDDKGGKAMLPCSEFGKT